MITIQLDQVDLGVHDSVAPNGVTLRILTCTDQSGIRVMIPFDQNAARLIAAALEGRPAIQIANGLPPS